MLLTESEIKLKKGKIGNNNIIYVTGNSYPYKDILAKYSAKYNNKDKFWFWFVKDDPTPVIEKLIKPALRDISEISKTPFQVDEIINAIDSVSENPEFKNIDGGDVKEKLKAFKEMLVNIDNDEDFKNLISKIIKIKAAQGYKFSFGNSILIWIQNSNATIVNNKTNWLKYYNRIVKDNARPLMVYAPQTSGNNKIESNDLKKLQDEFAKSLGKSNFNELTPNEKIRFESKLKGYTYATRFVFVPVYDVSDTIQIEGKEDYIKQAEDAKKDINWFEENMISDEVRPIYNGLLDFAKDKSIKVELVDYLDGARGVSASGLIQILKNEGNDVGLTKTLAHEISHELLHQTYLKDKGISGSEFHIGRNMSKGTIEQQAELSAWMFMHSFGFNVKTTSLNYTVMWGGNKDNMVKVFDTVSRVVNYMIDYVNTKIKTVNITESAISSGKHITPSDIANILGLSSEYNKIKNNNVNELNEGLIRSIIRESILKEETINDFFHFLEKNPKIGSFAYMQYVSTLNSGLAKQKQNPMFDKFLKVTTFKFNFASSYSEIVKRKNPEWEVQQRKGSYDNIQGFDYLVRDSKGQEELPIIPLESKSYIIVLDDNNKEVDRINTRELKDKYGQYFVPSYFGEKTSGSGVEFRGLKVASMVRIAAGGNEWVNPHFKYKHLNLNIT